MPKKYMIYGILIILLAVLGYLVYTKGMKTSPTPEIVETRDFSCPGMTGFTFKYPVFKGLENISQNLCELRIKTTKGWTFYIIKVAPVENITAKFDHTNPNGITYSLISEYSLNMKIEYLVKLGESSNSKIISISIGALPIWHTKIIRLELEEYSKAIINSLKPDPNFTPASDPIGRLVAELSSNFTWQNGLFPNIDLPPTASPEQVILKVFEVTPFLQGKVTNSSILEIREVNIPGSLPDKYIAVLVKTNFGEQIVLLKYDRQGWWSRVYDVPSN